MKICFFLISTTFSMLILQIFNDIVQVWDEIMVESAEMAAAPGASPTPLPGGEGAILLGVHPGAPFALSGTGKNILAF